MLVEGLPVRLLVKKLIELKGKTDRSIDVIEDFSTSLSIIDKTRRKPARIQKI